MIVDMKKTMSMTFVEVLKKRLSRKNEQLLEIESKPEGLATAVDKRKFIELKSSISELENCIDLAETMFNNTDE